MASSLLSIIFCLLAPNVGAWLPAQPLITAFSPASLSITHSIPNKSNMRSWHTVTISSTKTRDTAFRLHAGPAVVEPPVKEKTKEKIEKKDDEKVSDASTRKGGWAVRLFNDPMNKREFVAMCLTKVAGLNDGQAYQVMMQAHKNGVSIVGRYDFELAELYRNSLVEHGLLVDMIPVEDD